VDGCGSQRYGRKARALFRFSTKLVLLTLEFICRVVGITVCVKMDELTDEPFSLWKVTFAKRRR
jgi:hypothetical protein